MGYERDARGGNSGDYYGRNAAEDYGAGRDDYQGDYRPRDYGRQDRAQRQGGSYGNQQRGWTSEDRGGGFGRSDRDRDEGRERFSGGTDYYRSDDRGGDRGGDRGRRVGIYGNRDPERSYGRNTYRPESDNQGRAAQGSDDDRGFIARAGDEVRSWFGDEEAERRREQDARHDGGATGSYGRDEHYHSWRNQQIATFDRDYHEYRQENQSKFHNEFTSFRTERQGQRDLLGTVKEHAEVVGSDGEHVGTVDKVRGDRIILTKNDADAGGRHHSIPSRWLQSAEGNKVTLRKSAAEAKQHWRDEERQQQSGDGGGAMFGGRDGDDVDQGSTARHPTNLNRSFSGTY